MPHARRLLLLLALLLVPASLAEARLDDATFETLKKKASKLAKVADALPSKKRVIVQLAEDDQLRSVEVLVDWVSKAMRKVKKEYRPELDEATEDLQSFEKTLKASLPGQDWPPKTLPKPTKDSWDRKKARFARAKKWHDTELQVRYEIARAIEKVRDPKAVEFLLKKALKKLRKSDLTEEVARAVVSALTHADQELVGKMLLKEARNKKEPAARVFALEWLGRVKPGGAVEIAAEALAARESVVRRAAIRCMRSLDDPSCVKPLIEALRLARGLEPLEIEAILHYYTGNDFQGSHAIWMKWWADHGEAWLKSEELEERHRPSKAARKADGTYFYGLKTESERIVFVLDRSGSMQTPASAESKKAGEEGEGIEGDTKIDVAKSQMIWSIEHLPKNVYFNVVFYATEVEAWKEAPEMVPATKENKAAAVAWVKEITAEGSTALFDALLKALEYADNLSEKDPTQGGCDTIFLLSDGSPTKEGGQVVVAGKDLEDAWGRVKHANEIFQCVIHTVGIGRGHNRGLMSRIARETKGTYKAVGVR